MTARERARELRETAFPASLSEAEATCLEMRIFMALLKAEAAGADRMVAIVKGLSSPPARPLA